MNPTLPIIGLTTGVAVVSWLLWYGCQPPSNTRGNRLRKYLKLSNALRRIH